MTNSFTKTVLVARLVALGAAVVGVAIGPGGVATATPRPVGASALSSAVYADGASAGPRLDATACDDGSDDGDDGDDGGGDDGDGD
jgi:hypothetical protein